MQLTREKRMKNEHVGSCKAVQETDRANVVSRFGATMAHMCSTCKQMGHEDWGTNCYFLFWRMVEKVYSFSSTHDVQSLEGPFASDALSLQQRYGPHGLAGRCWIVPPDTLVLSCISRNFLNNMFLSG